MAARTSVVRVLFFLYAAVWLAFAAATLLRMLPGAPDQALVTGILAALMLGNAAALALAGWGLGRGSKLAYFYALALLAVNILLSITDQMGLWDWLFLAWQVVLLGLVLALGRRYVGGRNGERHTPIAGS